MNKSNRKNSKLLMLAAILFIIFIAAGITVFLFWNRKPAVTSEERLLDYMQLLEDEKYEEAYKYLDEDSQSSISKDDYVEKHSNIYGGIGAVEFRIEKSRIEESEKEKESVSYHTTLVTDAGEIAFVNQAGFVIEEKQYMLQWRTELIFPELTSADKVRVHTAESKRGFIFDRNGVLLAGEGTVSSVGIVPGKMTEDTNLNQLGKLLNVSAETIEKNLEASWVTEESLVPVKTITKAAEKKIKEELLKIPGVLISDTTSRVYPFGKKAAHLTGYVRNVTAEDLEEDKENVYTENSIIGKSGLERLYEDRLRGKDGVRIVIENSEGDTKKELANISAENGEDITLTIDAEIQTMIYDQYKKDKSASVVMNPETGEVLALVSTPSYDANDFVHGMSEKQWEKLNEDKEKPLYNRFTATWAPGSSFKPVVGALGVTSGKLDPEEDFGKSGLSWQKDESWGAYKITTLKEYKKAILENALIYSDNIYFAKAALKIGAETFMAELDKMGFGESLPFEIGTAESSYSNEAGISSEVALADSGYGQAQVLINPLHLASVYSAFSNGGNMLQPYLEYKKEAEAKYWKENIFSKEAVTTVNDALIQVIENPNGSGHKALMDDVILAGKTGTAEIKASQDDTDGTELGWFCVYTADSEQENPLLIVTMVEDVKDRGGSGYVVNRTKKILDQVYK